MPAPIHCRAESSRGQNYLVSRARADGNRVLFASDADIKSFYFLVVLPDGQQKCRNVDRNPDIAVSRRQSRAFDSSAGLIVRTRRFIIVNRLIKCRVGVAVRRHLCV